MDLQQKYVWFVTGSQHLYGEEPLKQVEENARQIADGLHQSEHVPVSVTFKAVLTSADSISELCDNANADPACIGLVFWMHTFSPARMWIDGLQRLNKPYVHLHTQFNQNIPWSEIDMDFINLNQSAHGGREFGYVCTRLGHTRKVMVGHWQDDEVQEQLGEWTRVAAAWRDAQGGRIARFGDNMRNVAVTEGDKVEAQRQFGYVVNGYGVGDLVEYVNAVSDADIKKVLDDYEASYHLDDSIRDGGPYRDSLKDSARIELGMKHFLEDGKFQGFTTTFEDLHGLKQLPGLAVQRLMAQGYGFGAEGDWKTAALIRAMKVMDNGLNGGTSFMEDYTYHFEKNNMRVLGAHMLEICASVSAGTPSLEVQPLDIGGKEAPARLVFDVPPGPAVNATIIDLGDRFRMITNDVEVVEPDQPLPNLPVARALWTPLPDLKTAAGAWILGGGAHHASFSQAVTSQHLEDFAEMAGIECVHIGRDTRLSDLKKELRWNEAYYSRR